jgi:predicted CoA-binding protein
MEVLTTQVLMASCPAHGHAANVVSPWGRGGTMVAAGPSPFEEEFRVTEAEVRDLLASSKVIAVVGLSPNADRPSNQIAWYLHHQGYEVYGVNPMCEDAEVFGVPVLASLDEVPKPIDVVDVFRRAEHTPEVARAAVAVGARALWLQLGVRSQEARTVAEAGGLAYVEDRCIKVEHARLLGSKVERH